MGDQPPLSGSPVTEDHIRYRLQAAGYSRALTPVRAEGGGFAVEPTRMLGDQDRHRVDAVLAALGAAWAEDRGRYGAWKIPGRAPSR